MAEENDLNINIGANAAGVEAGTRRARAAVKGVTDESKALDAAFRRLKTAIDPTFAAQEKYNKSLSDAKALQRAGIISKQEFTAATKAAKAALETETAAIQRNSAAGRAAAAEMKALKRQEAVDAKAAAAATIAAAREKAAAERTAARETAAAVKAAKAEEKAAIRAAATEAKVQAREAAAIEKAAKREGATAAKEAAQEAMAAARQKSAVEKAESRAAAEAEKQAKRELKTAARDATNAAVTAARARTAAEREAARTAREGAQATAQLARAERVAANAAQEMRASVDPAYAAQQRFNQTMRTATQLLMQNKLKQGEWIAIQKQAKTQMDINVRSLGRQNSMYVQLGYQAQDVTASLASGINPLVILAQQGGQTAAAMSQMGGKMGAVATFIAGPYGAAIIGLTLLLGYLWQSTKDNEKATLDLMNAESRRKAELPELTAAIEEFAKAQREANTSEAEALRLKGLMVAQESASAGTKLAAAQKKLADLEAAGRKLMSVKAPDSMTVTRLAQLTAFGVLSVQISRARAQVKLLDREVKALGKGGVEVDITASIERAKVATDALAAAKEEHDRVETNINNVYRERRALIDRMAAGKAKETALSNLNLMIDGKRNALARDYEALQKRINDAKRQGAKATTEETRQFMNPIDGGVMGSGFGRRSAPGGPNGPGSTNHPGVDIKTGGLIKAVRAAEDGVVRFAAVAGDYGNLIKIAHGGGTETRYGHMSSLQVESGQRVQKGDIIGMSGGGVGDPGRGNSTGRHLHYEVRVNGKPVDPSKGLFPVDQLDAEEAAIKAEASALREAHQAATDAHNDSVAEMEFRQTLAGEDLVQVLAIQDEKITAIKAFYGAESKEALRASRERVLIERRAEQQILADKKAALSEQLQAAQATANALKSLQDIGREIRTDNIDTAESTGMMSPEAARIAKAAVLDEEYADQQRFEESMYQLKLTYLRASLALPNVTRDEARRINSEILALEGDHLNSMRALNANYQKDVNSVRNQAFAAQVAKWRDMASTITGSMRQAFTGIWTHQTTFFQTMVDMADAIVYKFADMGQKILEDWLIKQAVKMGLIPAQQAAETAAVVGGQAAQTAAVTGGELTRQGIGATGVAVKGIQEVAKAGATVASEGVQTGAKVTGEATRGTVGATGAIAEIGTRAATSAAGAFSSTVVIPFIGPVAAPIAAAAALAAVLGFGALVSASGGQGEVTQDGQLTQLHKKEMVLPAWIAEPMRQNLKAGGNSAPMFSNVAAAGSSVRNTTNNSGGDTHLSYSPQYGDGRRGMDMDSMLKADANRLRRWMRKEMRNGTLQGGSR